MLVYNPFRTLHHWFDAINSGRHLSVRLMLTSHLVIFFVVAEVVQTLQLSADRDQTDMVGDLSVCLDGLSVDAEMFAAAEAGYHSESVRDLLPFQL